MTDVVIQEGRTGLEVSGETLAIFRWASQDLAGTEDALFGQDLGHLLQAPKRFAWTELCELYRRVNERLSIPIEVYATRVVGNPSFRPLVELGALVASPQLLYLLGNRFGLARSFSHLEVNHRAVPDGRIALNIVIPSTYEDSPEFLRATCGILQAFPRLLAMPDARVDLNLAPRSARYVIHPPPSMTLWARIRRAFAAFFLGRSALRELASQQDNLNEQIRELTKTRTELEHALQVKQRFLSVISHELRTPLNGLVGGASALRGEQSEEGRADLIESIQRSSDAMERVVLDLLEYTRLEESAAQPQPVQTDLATLLSEAVEHGRRRSEETGIAFEIYGDPSVSSLEVDATRAQQIVWHLVDNAFKFTAEGRVRVDVHVTTDTYPHIMVSVDDTGPGVAADSREHIFSLFAMRDDSSTRQHKGTGIGLPLCRRLAELLGGTLALEDSKLGGARFVTRLPCKRLKAATTTQPLQNDCPRLLVVDDNQVNRKVLRRILERLKWEVVEAENGHEAVNRVKERSFAAIFMDCAMPVMDGFEATRQIRRLVGQGARIIATTAYVTDDDRARCFAAGMNDFLPKPVKPAIIAQTLARWTGAPSPADAPQAPVMG